MIKVKGRFGPRQDECRRDNKENPRICGRHDFCRADDRGTPLEYKEYDKRGEHRQVDDPAIDCSRYRAPCDVR